MTIISCYLYHVISIMKWQIILRNRIPTLLTCKTWSIFDLRVRLETSQVGEQLPWMLTLQPEPLLQVVTIDGGGSGYSHGRVLLTIFVFVKMDFGHPPQGGVDGNKTSFCLFRAFVCLCVGAAGACAHAFGVQKSPHVSPCFGASHWPGTCVFSWGGWPLSPRSLLPRPL